MVLSSISRSSRSFRPLATIIWQAAVGVMLYGMFIAIVVPPAKTDKKILVSVILALCFSSAFTWLPVLKTVSAGLAIVICTVAAAGICAAVLPIEEEAEAAV